MLEIQVKCFFFISLSTLMIRWKPSECFTKFLWVIWQKTDLIHKELSYETTELVNDDQVSKDVYEGLDKAVKPCRSGEKEFYHDRCTGTVPIHLKETMTSVELKHHCIIEMHEAPEYFFRPITRLEICDLLTTNSRPSSINVSNIASCWRY